MRKQEPLYLEALEITQNTLGENHRLHVAFIILALLYQAPGLV